MNEKQFTELLNLYIDNEASPDERGELELEVRKNPRRHEKFLSYCRLQQASERIHRDLGDALAQTVDLNKYQIVARSSTRCCWRRGLLYSSGALAAACLTVAAAVSVLQDSQFSASFSQNHEDGFGLVEVFDPYSLNGPTENVRPHSFEASEPFTFAGRAHGLGRSQVRTAFLESGQGRFQVQAHAGGWSDVFPNDSSARGFRGHSTFDNTPELTSFRFQR
jgi:hypothetical protein